MPEVSVITICKNEFKNIVRTIESVKSQSYHNFEHILIDGGSSDGTLELLNPYKDYFSHFISEEDSGIYNAQNKGIKLAKGKYLLFLNAGDCLVDNNVFKDFFSEMQKDDILYGDMKILDKGKVIDGFSPLQVNLYFLLKSTLWHPVTFIKRDLFLKFGNYCEDYKIAADYEFFLRVICVEGASTKYFNRFVALFNTEGIGSSERYQQLHNAERKKAQLGCFPQSVLDMYESFKSLNESGLKVRVKFLWHAIAERFHL